MTNNIIKKNKGYKFRLLPNDEQKSYLNQAFGCSRKLYNIYVDLFYNQLDNQNYINGKIDFKNIKLPTPATIKKDYEYMKNIDSLAFANVQLDFQSAINKYNSEYDKKSYKKKAKKKEKTLGRKLTFRDLKGMPSFKSKKKNQNSFTTNNQDGTINIITENNECYVKIPKLKSLIKFINHRDIPSEYKIKSATISKDSRDGYYISFTVEWFAEENKIDVDQIKKENVLGLDYSQGNLYVNSENEISNYPRYYRITENKIKKEQRKLSRMELRSNNWSKQKKKINMMQCDIGNQRKDWLHKESYRIAEKYDLVCVEDINLRDLAQCLHLGKNIGDNGFGTFRIFLKYKLEDRGKYFIKADKWYPSSKTCNNCGYINKELDINDRKWECPSCREKIERDYNAAKNLRDEGMRILKIK